MAKYRSSFVSNSSSSSFTCDVCGNTESGWDLCLSEAEMVATKWGICCQSEFDKFIKERKLDGKLEKIQEDEEYPYLECIEGSEKICPFYNLYYFKREDIVSYLLKRSELTMDDVREELLNKFDNLEELRKYLKK